MTRTGIIAPMPVEAAPFLEMASAVPQITETGVALYRWESAGHQICLVRSGIGLRRAARAAQHLIEDCRVDRIIISGVAGGLSPDLPVGSVVLPETVRVYSHNAAGGLISEGPTGQDSVGPVHRVDWALREGAIAACQPGACGGLLVSVRGLVTSPELLLWFAEGLQAKAVDMESAAVAEVCAGAGVPFVAVRALSDHAPELGQWDWASLARARQRGKAATGWHLLRSPSLARRLRVMKRDTDRGARIAARIVRDILEKCP